MMHVLKSRFGSWDIIRSYNIICLSAAVWAAEFSRFGRCFRSLVTSFL